MDKQVLFAATVFLIVYALIISKKIHRTVLAMAGGMLVIAAGVLSQEQAIHHIDFNTIGLLIGMMIIVGITAETGLSGQPKGSVATRKGTDGDVPILPPLHAKFR